MIMYKTYGELMNKTLNQLAAIKSPDEIDNKRAFAHLLLDIYFDALSIPESTEDRTDALKEIFKPMLDAAKLAPPPGFAEKYERMKR